LKREFFENMICQACEKLGWRWKRQQSILHASLWIFNLC
jgi:hypothetical protein